MLRNMEPPVGFGKKCPYRLAYRVRLPPTGSLFPHSLVHKYRTQQRDVSLILQRGEEVRGSVPAICPLSTRTYESEMANKCTITVWYI